MNENTYYSLLLTRYFLFPGNKKASSAGILAEEAFKPHHYDGLIFQNPLGVCRNWHHRQVE